MSRTLVDREHDKFVEGAGGETLVRVTGVDTDPVPVSLTPAAQSPTIYNISVVLAGTEYSQALTAGTKKLTIRNRDRGTVRIAFSIGGTSSTWFTLPRGTTLSLENLNLSAAILYVQSDTAAQTVEVLEFA